MRSRTASDRRSSHGAHDDVNVDEGSGYTPTEERSHEPAGGRAPTFFFEGVEHGMDVEALLRPVVERAGLELVDVTLARETGRRVLRVTVDRDGGVDLDTITAITQMVSRRLDLEDAVEGRYHLEVTSPGIERPLRTASQFARATGARVQVKTNAPVEDVGVHTGRLIRADDEAIEVDVDGELRRIELSEVASARTVADWAAELKGAGS
jgi:ribosome maturation factor RimP